MAEPREEKVVEALQHFYFNTVSGQDAKRLHAASSLGVAAPIAFRRLRTPVAGFCQWHSSLGVLAPAQAQKLLGHAAYYDSSAAMQLHAFASHTFSQLRLKDRNLPDAPTEPFPDKWVLEDCWASPFHLQLASLFLMFIRRFASGVRSVH